MYRYIDEGTRIGAPSEALEQLHPCPKGQFVTPNFTFPASCSHLVYLFPQFAQMPHRETDATDVKSRHKGERSMGDKIGRMMVP